MSDSLRFFDGQPYTRKEHLETFTIGDKIGCGVEHIGDSVQVYFNKNGAAVSESGWTSRFLGFSWFIRIHKDFCLSALLFRTIGNILFVFLMLSRWQVFIISNDNFVVPWGRGHHTPWSLSGSWDPICRKNRFRLRSRLWNVGLWGKRVSTPSCEYHTPIAKGSAIFAAPNTSYFLFYLVL